MSTPSPFNAGMASRIVDKPIIRVGDWVEKDGQRLAFDDAMCKTLIASFDEMKSRGVAVPVLWGHEEDSRNEAGHVVGLGIDADGWLSAKLELTDDEAAEKVGKVVRNVSPRVMVGSEKEPVVDGKGNRYAAAMLHLALVPRPVIPGQRNFSDSALCLSLSLGGSQMSDVTLTAPAGKTDLGPAAGSAGAKAMWAKVDNAGGKKKDGSGYDSDKMEDNWSFAMDSSTSPEDAAKALVSHYGKDAMKAAMALAMGDEEPDCDETTAAPAPVQEKRDLPMSLDDIKPRDRRNLELGRAGIKAQVDGLLASGRVTPVIHRDLCGKLGRGEFLLALNTSNPGDTDVEKAIAHYEAIPAGTFAGTKPKTGDYRYTLERRVEADRPKSIEEQQAELARLHPYAKAK
jgi:hypothetical protein